MSCATDRFLAAFCALQGVRESPKGSNRDPAIDAMLHLCGVPPGKPWCAACVSWAGHCALGSDWPLPRTASCDVLMEAAQRLGMLRSPSGGAEPGDVFLLCRTTADAIHTGAVLHPAGPALPGAFVAIEGNASDPNAPPSNEGWGVFSGRTRGHASDPALRRGYSYLLIRWDGLIKE